MLKCGAHLHERKCVIGEKLCSAAAVGNLSRLQSYFLAGADFRQPDVLGRTALHVAAITNAKATARFLIDHGVDVNACDLFGNTAQGIAKLTNSLECLSIFSDGKINSYD